MVKMAVNMHLCISLMLVNAECIYCVFQGVENSLERVAPPQMPVPGKAVAPDWSVYLVPSTEGSVPLTA